MQSGASVPIFPDFIRATCFSSPLPFMGGGRGEGMRCRENTLSRPAGTLGFGILRRPTSCIHAVVSHE
ncbi:hypothetical protein C7A17_14505 [Ectopseudomonas mendocina]|uniref:Uncharacterized protein n=1 Tax=Ectopseudomonas mendocina TaxID=300 RepID=A0A2R3QQD6_ECTME|nr:hypothetical protein C7A17_14505 [Pseudomonas mendocina]